MIKEKEVYRFREDTIAQFEEACCVEKPDPTIATSFSDIKAAFDPWYKEHITEKRMSPKKLGTLLGKKFTKTTTKGNLPAYIGIEVKHYMDD